MKKFEYKGKQWHDECFICAECNQPIGNKSFIPRDDRVICVPCYESNYAQKCSKCSGVRYSWPSYGPWQCQTSLSVGHCRATMPRNAPSVQGCVQLAVLRTLAVPDIFERWAL